ncbi:MAG TPA: hypothetical protein VH353_07940 [Caulobacteraceae bacterium]|jgi:hypothetical protein|nr:hypothetical protein [Caulobacteraceae bacterium]
MTKTEVIIVSLPVADQARAKAFCSEKLGFTVTMEAKDAMGPGKSWITVQPHMGIFVSRPPGDCARFA